MRSPEIYLSFNEIMFYFTRAAVGGGVPFGLAEDFGRASIWIAASGLDPSGVAVKALNDLDCGNSCLKTNLIETNNEILLTAERSKKLSAIQVGAVACDLISAQTEKQENIRYIIAKNVDYPFLVCAALGASNCNGWEISWTTEYEIPYSVLICTDGSWKSSWEFENMPEVIDPVDLKIMFFNRGKDFCEKWEGKTLYSVNIKKKVLETGVPVYDSWSEIYSFFKRCLVPSTKESRNKGAGAGLVDID